MLITSCGKYQTESLTLQQILAFHRKFLSPKPLIKLILQESRRLSKRNQTNCEGCKHMEKEKLIIITKTLPYEQIKWHVPDFQSIEHKSVQTSKQHLVHN